MSKDEVQKVVSYGLVGQLGLSIVVPLLLGVLGGRWLDQLFGTGQQFVLGGIFLGLWVAGYEVYVQLKPLFGGKKEKLEGNSDQKSGGSRNSSAGSK